jgi:hypothetical protein
MIEANKSIFSSLDQFCLQSGDAIRNADKSRWIISNPSTRVILKDAYITSLISFASTLKVARFDHDSAAYFFTLGLDLAPSPPHNSLNEIDLDGSLLTLALAELQPRPVLSSISIRNVIEADDKESNSEYKGHDSAYIASLFPSIRCFEAINIPPDETQRIFFLFCLSDLSRANTWMETDLKDTFATLSELNPTTIPYKTLCRSVFDTDPSSVFLALYRCLEALYAHSHVTALSKELGISQSWDKVAEILEKNLRWHPREESSLVTLLREDTLETDLNEVLHAMSVTLQPNGDVFNVATKQIYQLRNSLVHYRPFHQQFDSHNVDWNRLCMAMCGLVHDVYDRRA